MEEMEFFGKVEDYFHRKYQSKFRHLSDEEVFVHLCFDMMKLFIESNKNPAELKEVLAD